MNNPTGLTMDMIEVEAIHDGDPAVVVTLDGGLEITLPPDVARALGERLIREAAVVEQAKAEAPTTVVTVATSQMLNEGRRPGTQSASMVYRPSVETMVAASQRHPAPALKPCVRTTPLIGPSMAELRRAEAERVRAEAEKKQAEDDERVRAMLTKVRETTPRVTAH